MNTPTHFSEQFTWQPTIENAEALLRVQSFVVCGMGGSHLGAQLLMRHDPRLLLSIHSDYDLPLLSSTARRETLFIASSYSGTTEETLSAARAALAANLPLAVITGGGELLSFAREHAVPLVAIPQTGIEPRMAVGYFMLATAALMNDAGLVSAIQTVGSECALESDDEESVRLARVLEGKTPYIYASGANGSIAQYWKISFNETTKIPAAYNIFPELCHNELAGFDTMPPAHELIASIHPIILEDVEDHPRVRMRMKILSDILSERGVQVERVSVRGASALHKIFNSVLLAESTAAALGAYYGVTSPQTPIIAEFKRRMSDLTDEI